MFHLIKLCFGTVVRLFRSRHSLLLENLALRQQLVVLKRHHPRPRLGLSHKLFWLVVRQRQHISEALGAFDTGDSRWYGWLSEQLLRYGSERDTRTLMQNFLGRPVSPPALLEQIHRLKPGAFPATGDHSTGSAGHPIFLRLPVQ